MPIKGLSLVGFLSEREAISQMRRVCKVSDDSDAALSGEWKAARAKLGPPMPRAGQPDIQPVPQAGQAYVAQLQATPWMRAAMQGSLAGAVVQMVEIDPLLAFQHTVDIDRINRYQNGGNGAPPVEELLQICLPLSWSLENVWFHPMPNSLMVTSHGLDFHPVNQGLIHTPAGSFLGMQFGVSVPLVHVVRHNGRNFLHNGYHRVVGARKRGATHVPCVVREVANYDAVGIKPIGTFQVELLESNHPPTVGHFTQGRAYDVMMKRFTRTLHVTWADYVTTEE